jgi:hypothetical protein
MLSTAVLGLIAAVLLILRFYTSRSPPLPPGPNPLPLIGNVHQIPKERDWLTYAHWAKKYGEMVSSELRLKYPSSIFVGDIVYIHDFGRPIIILNSFNAAHDLLEKRSDIYSGRPKLVRIFVPYVQPCSYPVKSIGHVGRFVCPEFQMP